MHVDYIPSNTSEIGFGSDPFEGGLNIFQTFFCAVYIVRVALYPIRVSLLPHGKIDCKQWCCPYKEEWEIKYYYYSKKQSNGVQLKMHPESESGVDLEKSGFNPDWPTVFAVHGWVGGIDVMALRIIKDAFLKRPENHNVILVDWGAMSSFIYYHQSAKNVRTVGQNIAQFILSHNKPGLLSIPKIHLVGFSLGGQIVGFAGKFMKANGITLPWITGIDPAYPDFEHGDCTTRICPLDADFVDIIHVDANVLGLEDAVGQMDFYANGGTDPQPDCGKLYFNNIAQFGAVSGLPCSHFTGPIYYAKSIVNPKMYVGIPWQKNSQPCTNCGMHNRVSNSTVYMGYDSIKSKGMNGTYYVNARFLNDSPWDFIFGGTV